jgi:MoaA/NifB/PqqE/SkfB family radical SAM enzyme
MRECRLDEIKRIADNFASLGLAAVLLTGGEPFARQDLPESIKALTDRGVLVQINSNVRMQPEKIFGQLNHHLSGAAYNVRLKIWSDDVQQPSIVLHRRFV